LGRTASRLRRSRTRGSVAGALRAGGKGRTALARERGRDARTRCIERNTDPEGGVDVVRSTAMIDVRPTPITVLLSGATTRLYGVDGRVEMFTTRAADGNIILLLIYQRPTVY
jgi:hypothetical protein